MNSVMFANVLQDMAAQEEGTVLNRTMMTTLTTPAIVRGTNPRISPRISRQRTHTPLATPTLAILPTIRHTPPVLLPAMTPIPLGEVMVVRRRGGTTPLAATEAVTLTAATNKVVSAVEAIVVKAATMDAVTSITMKTTAKNVAITSITMKAMVRKVVAVSITMMITRPMVPRD